MVAVIDSPDFMFFDIKIKDASKLKKIYFFIKGVIVGSIYKNTEKKLFCFLMNIFFPKSKKIFYNNGMYLIKLDDGYEINYPNKRIVRIFRNENFFFKFMLETYCIDKLILNNNDIVVDCGANVGELFFALNKISKNLNYTAIEPDVKVFNALERNLKNFKNTKLYKFAASNNENKEKLYTDDFGANSSLEYFGSESYETVETKKIDSLNLENVKLLKIEAEGHEENVLKGCEKTLSYTNYVVIDYGPEKGIEQVSTMKDVINYMYKNNFILIATSPHRQVGLFENQKYV